MFYYSTKIFSWLIRTKLRSYPQMHILPVAPVHLSIRHCFGNGDQHRPEQKLTAIRPTPYIITYLFIRHEKWCMCLDIIIKNWSTERGQKIENVQTIFCFCKIFGGFLTSFFAAKTVTLQQTKSTLCSPTIWQTALDHKWNVQFFLKYLAVFRGRIGRHRIHNHDEL